MESDFRHRQASHAQRLSACTRVDEHSVRPQPTRRAPRLLSCVRVPRLCQPWPTVDRQTVRCVLCTLFLTLCVGPHLLAQTPPKDVPTVQRQNSSPQPSTLPIQKLNLAGRVQDRKPIPSAQEDPEEAAAYADTLAAAHRTSPAALAQLSRRDVTFAHLFEEPQKYRGDLIHVEGRLRRVRRFDAPKFIEEAHGIKVLYEGWLFEPDVYGANPRCVIFTHLPPGIGVGEDTDYRVSFDGYFFKRYRYKAGDGWRDAPLFIAPTLTLSPMSSPSPISNSPFSAGTLATGFVGLIVATAALALVLGCWYWRGDRQVRARLGVGNRLMPADPDAGYEIPDRAESK
jgi:hypothetical protein